MDFLRFLFLPTLKDPNTSFKGKNVIVTGSNVGLGFEAAVKFVERNASKVILAVRSVEKGRKAQSAIEERTGRRGCIEVWPLDMSDYDSIKAFAERASSELNHLDVAVLNAGVYMLSYELSQYAWEMTVQVNALSTVLLALILLPKLKASRSHDSVPTLEFVSSGRHKSGNFSSEESHAENLLEMANRPGHYASGVQYARSKFFLMCACYELLRLVERNDGTPEVVITATCPGPCQSELARGLNWFWNVLKFLLFTLLFRTTEQGSRTLVSGAALGYGGHGQFWQHDKFQPKAPALTGKEGEKLQKRVWHEVIDALRKDVPEVLELAKKGAA